MTATSGSANYLLLCSWCNLNLLQLCEGEGEGEGEGGDIIDTLPRQYA